jgi:hypothetical protein
MMGEQKSEPQLFNYAVNLDKRVRSNHPLRRIKELIDFGFAREEVAHCYGSKGNVSVDPEVILKMMFLLFFDDVASERELMKIIAERLDYLWFLGYGLEEEIPDHSVLSKAPTEGRHLPFDLKNRSDRGGSTFSNLLFLFGCLHLSGVFYLWCVPKKIYVKRELISISFATQLLLRCGRDSASQQKEIGKRRPEMGKIQSLFEFSRV